jgi:hypothetical protein
MNIISLLTLFECNCHIVKHAIGSEGWVLSNGITN